jgi:hypothetical protein
LLHCLQSVEVMSYKAVILKICKKISGGVVQQVECMLCTH